MSLKKHVAFERSYVYLVHIDTICVSDCNPTGCSILFVPYQYASTAFVFKSRVYCPN